MFMLLNITKSYIIDKPFETCFSQLDSIIPASFNNANYITFGNFVSADPPEFIFINKPLPGSYVGGRPDFFTGQLTKISVKLFKLDEKSKIVLETKTNYTTLVLFFILLIIAIIKFVTQETTSDIKSAGGLVLLTVCLALVIGHIMLIVIYYGLVAVGTYLTEAEAALVAILAGLLNCHLVLVAI